MRSFFVWATLALMSGYCYGAATVLALDHASPNAWGWPWFVIAGTALAVASVISHFIALDYEKAERRERDQS